MFFYLHTGPQQVYAGIPVMDWHLCRDVDRQKMIGTGSNFGETIPTISGVVWLG